MRYLVTGGAGFIGTNLVTELIKQGNSVVVLDNYAGGRQTDRVVAGVEYVEGDIRDASVLDRVCAGADGIFHLAALPRVSYSVEQPWEVHDVNVNGTLQVLLAAKRHHVKRVVLASTAATYGEQTTFPLVEDTMVRNPISPYGLHKLVGEHYVRLFSELYGVEGVSLIYFNVYGPHFDPNGPYALVVGKFLQQAKEGQPLTVCGDGEYYRDYIHVSDVVAANLAAMTSPTVGKGEVINIGTNNPQSVNQLVAIIDRPVVKIPERPGDGRYFTADISKAKRLLGWEPTIQIAEGINAMKKEMGL